MLTLILTALGAFMAAGGLLCGFVLLPLVYFASVWKARKAVA